MKPVYCRQLSCIEPLVNCRIHVIALGDSYISKRKEFMNEKRKSNIKLQGYKIDTYRPVSIILFLSQKYSCRAVHDIQTDSQVMCAAEQVALPFE